ncbi:MAG: GTPase [Kiritimatiellia bacterium]
MARHLQSVEAVLEQSDPADASRLRRLRDELAAKREARRLEIAAVGTVSSGKSALLNALAGRKAFASDVRGGTTTALADTAWDAHEEVRLVDTPGLGEVGGRARRPRPRGRQDRRPRALRRRRPPQGSRTPRAGTPAQGRQARGALPQQVGLDHRRRTPACSTSSAARPPGWCRPNT